MSLNNLGWIISDLFNTITTLLIVAVVVVLFVFAFKYENSRKFILFGICFVLIVAAIFAAINIWERMTASSYTNGKIEYVDVNYEKVFSTEINPLILYAKDDGTYYFDDNLAAVEFDATKADYEIFVNGRPTNNVELGAGFIESDFVLEVYDINNSIVSKIILDIRLEFLTTQTHLLITSKLTAEDEAFLRTYISNNSFVVEVAYATYTPVVKILD